MFHIKKSIIEKEKACIVVGEGRGSETVELRGRVRGRTATTQLARPEPLSARYVKQCTYLRRYEEQGNMENIPPRPGPRVTTATHDRYIAVTYRAEPFMLTTVVANVMLFLRRQFVAAYAAKIHYRRLAKKL
ncbi:hypothetical protein EVAR_65126_1 [Eumeta japonica]|uniref:Uncharacterized protein n=1 Tax=Eumeta variegata TaxID=151549 RepID=A0A4C1Z719_EUMVA|nr:hypothetical protein EVAR_65126_1 [Eumeta japonica]